IYIMVNFLLISGVSDAGSDGVSVKEGDPVTLHTDVKINHRDIMMWYFNTIRIAYINGVQKICTDKQCPERFRDGLKLDNQTGSLTITNTRTTDSGEYKLVGGSNSGKIFNVIMHTHTCNCSFVSAGVFGDTDEVKSVMEGDRVTLNPGVTKESDMVRWYFNSILIAMIDGKSCSYDGEGGRFRDRLKEDNETRSLTITNITTQHAGHYEAEVFSESSGKNEHLNRPSSCDSTKIIPKSSNLGEIIKSISLTVSVISRPVYCLFLYVNDLLQIYIQ
uniref:Immunoglobulin domain-containing protein n=1 Tax=Sinocyclocheilus anshuiensis TaxID=1608454 RepID=A0A671M368_9TELE